LFQQVSGLLPIDAVPYPRTTVKVATQPKKTSNTITPSWQYLQWRQLYHHTAAIKQ